MLVAEIREQGQDAAGVKIIDVYIKQSPHYAIYRTDSRVMVHFADAEDEAKKQSAILAPLNPVRGQINGLIDGWRFSKRENLKAKAKRYDRRVADALGVAMQNDATGALTEFNGIKADIVDERTSWARFQYLIAASVVSIAVILLVWVVSTWFLAPTAPDSPAPARNLWLALAGGTVGAFFSIAIAIRKRTVLTDLLWVDNTADAVLRVVIGAIAAAVLVSLVQLKAIDVSIGDAKLDGSVPYGWLYALVVAVIAGFSERMIPDLLEKSAAAAAAQSNAPLQPAPAADQKQPAAAGDASGAAAQQQLAVHDHKQAEDEYRLEDCLCDKAVQPHEATSDAELPAATGGVAAPRIPAGAVS
jgi:hypothetical protein